MTENQCLSIYPPLYHIKKINYPYITLLTVNFHLNHRLRIL